LDSFVFGREWKGEVERNDEEKRGGEGFKRTRKSRTPRERFKIGEKEKL
jgi:hypothetical protein